MAVADERRLEDYLFAEVQAEADGDNEIVAAVAGRKIRVVDCHLTVVVAASAEGVIVFETGTGGTELARFNLGSGEASIDHCGPVPMLETADGERLVISNGAGVDTYGSITYILTQ